MHVVFLVAFTLCFLSIVVILVRYSLRSHRASTASWESLLDRLNHLNPENVALVALDLVDEDGNVRRSDWPELDADQVWNLVGGLEGLDKIEANCDVFVEIAMHLQLTYPEAIVITEEFRRKTRHIQWHINRLRAGERTGNLAANFSTYAQRAVASYYLMSRQLLTLCEQTQFEGLERLRLAL